MVDTCLMEDDYFFLLLFPSLEAKEFSFSFLSQILFEKEKVFFTSFPWPAILMEIVSENTMELKMQWFFMKAVTNHLTILSFPRTIVGSKSILYTITLYFMFKILFRVYWT